MTDSRNRELHEFTEHMRDVTLEMLEVQAKILKGLADRAPSDDYRAGVLDCIAHIQGTIEAGRKITREEIEAKEAELSQIHRAVASSKFAA